jgi:gamma-glutamyltranspeptidase / glutathione hydrolase
MRQYFFLLVALILMACHTDESNSGQHYGVVTSASPEATQAGMEILKQGGNAIDAAVAVSFVLGVTEPAMSGLGGGTQMLLAVPGQKPISINGTTWSPAATPVDATQTDLKYHRRSTIPSTVKVLDFVLRKYGSGHISWEETVAPAIQFAENGFKVGEFRHRVYKLEEDELRNSPYSTGSWLMSDGTIPAVGETIVQSVLAKTLRQLARNGANDFYKGEIATLIAEDMAENGGWITLADLHNFPEPVELTPLNTNYRGFRVYSQPPPSGGWAVLMILNLLEHAAVDELLEPDTRTRIILEALHITHQNRKNAPVEDLANYHSAIEEKVSKSYAAELLSNFSGNTGSELLFETESGETTHFSIVDNDGMAVAVTTSINAIFGAKAASPKLGFLYNTYMDDFELGKPQHPFAIRPNAMAYSSMSPTIVQKDGQTVLVLGSPGSARIISAVAQVTQQWIDSDLGIVEVVAMPRLHSVDGKVYLENLENNDGILDVLRSEGFEVFFPADDLARNGMNAYFGGIHAIAREGELWKGVADPRRDGLSSN